jgi:hypothetical protein
MAQLRCPELGLATPREKAKTELTILLTVQTLNYLYGGRHRIAP